MDFAPTQKGKPMSDLISRQDAIDAMAELQGRASSKGELTGISKAWKKIKKLPSAQPEDCDTCKHGYFGDDQCERCRVRYLSHYERRTDGVDS